MDSFWNRTIIPAPPTISVVYHLKKKNTEKCYEIILGILEKGIEILSEDSCLASEMYILKRILYRLQNQMKREKNFQALKQIQRCVKNFNYLKLKNIFQNLKECIYKGSNSDEVHLPSKHMFEYLLTRLIGAVHVLIQASNHCERCYIHTLQRLYPGHFILKNLMFSGLSARIWVITRALALQLSYLYKQLHEQLVHLKNQQTRWLPCDVELPNTLKNWETKIGDPPKLNSSSRCGVGKKDIDDIINRMEKKDQGPEQVHPIKPDHVIETTISLSQNISTNFTPENVDLGVAVSRKKTEPVDKKSSLDNSNQRKRKKDLINDTSGSKPSKIVKSSDNTVRKKTKKKKRR